MKETIVSPRAAGALLAEINIFGRDGERLMGKTDCPEGCVVEPDAECPHRYESAALTAGVTISRRDSVGRCNGNTPAAASTDFIANEEKRRSEETGGLHG